MVSALGWFLLGAATLAAVEVVLARAAVRWLAKLGADARENERKRAPWEASPEAVSRQYALIALADHATARTPVKES